MVFVKYAKSCKTLEHPVTGFRVALLQEMLVLSLICYPSFHHIVHTGLLCITKIAQVGAKTGRRDLQASREGTILQIDATCRPFLAGDAP